MMDELNALNAPKKVVDGLVEVFDGLAQMFAGVSEQLDMLAGKCKDGGRAGASGGRAAGTACNRKERLGGFASP